MGLTVGLHFPVVIGESQSPVPSCCSGKIDESSFYIGSYELNASSICGINARNWGFKFRNKNVNPTLI